MASQVNGAEGEPSSSCASSKVFFFLPRSLGSAQDKNRKGIRWGMRNHSSTHLVAELRLL